MIRILHVDDREDDSELIRYSLNKISDELEIIWSDSADNALDEIDEKDIDCILCDFQMPGMNGLDLLKTLRQSGNDLPFIFLTSQGSESGKNEALVNGAFAYYRKELGNERFPEILQSIREAVRARKKQTV